MKKIFPRHNVNLSAEILNTALSVIRKKEIFEGDCVRDFERKFASYTGNKYAVGISSGMAGLSMAIKALELKEGDEILLSGYNFYKVPFLLKASGLSPVFIDIHPETFNIDISKIKDRISKKSKAILVTHLFGHPCEMNQIVSLAKVYNLKIIEDCAHACGADYNGRKVGSFGDIGIFSFALGKNIPCFGGGAIVTDNMDLWEKISALIKRCPYPSMPQVTKTALIHLFAYFATGQKVFSYLVYPVLRSLDLCNIMLTSYQIEKIRNFDKYALTCPKKMLNLQAAVGIKQLERMDAINEKLRTNGLCYNALLKDVQGIRVPAVLNGAKHIYLYYNILAKNRDLFRKKLLKEGIDTEKNNLSACSDFTFIKSNNHCPVSKILVSDALILPNNLFLSENDISYITDCVRRISKAA